MKIGRNIWSDLRKTRYLVVAQKMQTNNLIETKSKGNIHV